MDQVLQSEGRDSHWEFNLGNRGQSCLRRATGLNSELLVIKYFDKLTLVCFIVDIILIILEKINSSTHVVYIMLIVVEHIGNLHRSLAPVKM